MRVLGALVAGALVLAGSARAEDQGGLGIRIQVADGKLKVVNVVKDGPADKAGLKVGDVITQVGDHKVKDAADEAELNAAIKAVSSRKPGDKIKVTVSRGGKDQAIEATTGKRADLFPGTGPKPKDMPKDKPKDKPKDAPKDKPKDAPKDKPKDAPKDKPKDAPKDKPKDKPADSKDKPKDKDKPADSKDKPKDKDKKDPDKK